MVPSAGILQSRHEQAIAKAPEGTPAPGEHWSVTKHSHHSLICLYIYTFNNIALKNRHLFPLYIIK